MPRRIILSLCLWMAILSVSAQKQVEVRYDSIVCYGSEISSNTFVRPPKSILHNTQRVETSSFVMTYEGFSEEAQTAFQYALDIWDALIDSPVPIYVTAKWVSKEPGTLGSARWADLVLPGNAGLPNSRYPLPLAEKITGKDINFAGQPDFTVEFNSDYTWYYGTDGETPEGITDLVSVVMHEIGHGLGITDSFWVGSNTGNGYFGPREYTEPMIYDRFVVNPEDLALVDLFPSNSAGLGESLMSNALYFMSPIAALSYSGSYPKLYAPGEWDSGSSIAHLDESTYPAGDVNSLMSPRIGRAEAIHHPGPLVLGMLADLGWIHTYLTHTPNANTEEVNNPIPVSIEVTSDTELQTDGVIVYYSTDHFQNDLHEKILSNTGGSTFEANFDAFQTETIVEYYVEVTDDFGRIYREPYAGYHSFEVGIDTENPVMIHEPTPFIFNTEPNLLIAANVTDNYAVKEVLLTYQFNEGLSQTIEMVKVNENGDYEAVIDFSQFDFSEEDLLRYSIFTSDGAMSENTDRFPDEGEYPLKIYGFREAVLTYSNDLEEDNSDFVGIGFTIEQPEGFASKSIHSEHPYPNAKTMYFVLRTPIKLQEFTMLRFDEIVLVEPGPSGSPTANDFITIEGSRDFGKTWNRLANSYDSRDEDSWFTHYFQNVEEGVSLNPGQPELYVERAIGLLDYGYFQQEEEIILRFLLSSDESARGWGWSIDNILISNEVVASQQEPSQQSITIFPNPTRGALHFSSDGNKWSNPDIELSDLHGKVLKRFEASQNYIDLKQVEAGMYLLRFIVGNEVLIKRIVVRD